MEHYKHRQILRMNSTLDNSILSIEGSHNRIKELPIEQVEDVLKRTKKAIHNLDGIYYEMDDMRVFDEDSNVRDKFKYLLKC